MSQWAPHATVACVIAVDGKYLMVEERDKLSREMVFNQPAGHLEAGESLVDAALRETLEETGWRVELIGVLGLSLYHSTERGTTYYRTTFIAKALGPVENATLDPDIHAVHWLDYEEILVLSDRMRSPVTLAVIERHRQGVCHPLDLIHSP
jgi:8-oxo-dGTP pyrophosphatase MutT (NUDIX family)